MDFIITTGLLSIIGALIYTFFDFGTDKLNISQKEYVEECKECLMDAVIDAIGLKDLHTEDNYDYDYLIDENVLSNIASLNVTGIFRKTRDGEEDSISETRKGRLFGLGKPRTILRADFFESTQESQYKTLIHESYHSGTRDWSEEKSYDYTELVYMIIEDLLKGNKSCPTN